MTDCEFILPGTEAEQQELNNSQNRSPARKRSPLELLMALFPEHAAENIQVITIHFISLSKFV